MSEQGPPTPDPYYGYSVPPPPASPPSGYPPPGWPPQAGYGPPPGYQPQPPGYGYGYGYQAGYYGDGPPGRIRPTGTSILLFIVTFGVYGFVYNYSVHDEMRRHSGRGIGGGVALLLTFLAYVAMPFVTPAEVGALYARRGQRPPVSGWTGLWTVVPWIGGYILWFFITFAAFASDTNVDDDFGNLAAGAVFGFLIWIGAVIAGGVIGFVKTNDALNHYWAAIGVQSRR